MTEEQLVRCFIGVPATVGLEAALNPLLAQWHSSDWAQRVRWVDSRNWHLTLAFLGDRTFPFIQQLQASLQSALQKSNAASVIHEFALNSSRICGFPDVRSRIIALEFKSSDSLSTLKAIIDEVLLAQGVQPEKRGFRPHLTLGRLKREQRAHFDPVVCEAVLPVQELILFKSTLTAEGSEYSPLWTLPLSG